MAKPDRKSHRMPIGLLRARRWLLTAALGHSVQLRPRPLVHKCPLCINTDRKFWTLGFVAMCQQPTFDPWRCASPPSIQARDVASR